MLHKLPAEVRTLGADLRALRKARGLTLASMADDLGKSVGWLSQVERDISEPSIDDLRAFARMLDVSVSSLFRVEELLSPDLTDDFEVVHSAFEAGATMTHAVCRPTQEVGYIVSGQLDLWIDDTCFHLNPGDSFRIRGQHYRWANPHDVTCKAIWVIAPPVY